jgi:integrase
VIEALERQMMRQSIARMQNPDLWQEQEWVFTTKTGTAIYPSNMSYRYKQFIKRNKLRHIRIHDLRHTSAVLALTSGMPLEAVSQGLGHSRLDITKDVYAPHVPKLNEDFGFGLAAYIQSQKPMNVPSSFDQEVPRNF